MLSRCLQHGPCTEAFLPVFPGSPDPDVPNHLPWGFFCFCVFKQTNFFTRCSLSQATRMVMGCAVSPTLPHLVVTEPSAAEGGKQCVSRLPLEEKCTPEHEVAWQDQGSEPARPWGKQSHKTAAGQWCWMVVGREVLAVSQLEAPLQSGAKGECPPKGGGGTWGSAVWR